MKIQTRHAVAFLLTTCWLWLGARPAPAQMCEALYALTGNPSSPSLTLVGCALPGETSNCSAAPNGSWVTYDGPVNQPNGTNACHVCLQTSAVQIDGASVTPQQLVERRAWGLLRKVNKVGSLYSPDLTCLREPGLTCTSDSPYACRTCAAYPQTAFDLDGWSFEGNYGSRWGATASSWNPPGFTSGVRDAGARFTSTSQYLQVPSAATGMEWIGQEDFSFEGWIRTEYLGVQVVLSKRRVPGDGAVTVTSPCACPSTGYCGLQVITYQGRIGIQISDGNWLNYISSDPQAFVADGEWHHFAVTVDRDNGSGLKYYVDGRPAGTANPTGRQGCVTNGKDLFLGGQDATSSYAFVGELDELNVWYGVLTASEIAAIFDAGGRGHCYI